MSDSASFGDFALNRQLLNAIAEKGYVYPTAIQKKAIPAILAGQDVMGIAQTGTGKTAAYVLPLLMKIKYAQGMDPRALILVPTRELALQVLDNLRGYGKYTDLRFLALYGGTGLKKQLDELAGGADILVATPGRFWEAYLTGNLVTKKLQVLVLDEADRLMDMGFLPQIHRILEVVPRKKQNLLFSATISDLVKKIAGDFLEFPSVFHVEPEQKTASTVSQKVIHVPNFATKLNVLRYFMLDLFTEGKIIVFCKSKANANRVFEELKTIRGIRVIHSNKSQNTRLNTINAFRNNAFRILIATDVAARGLDISEVTHVINFDIPVVYDDYIHRIGRTGRAEREGESYTLVNDAEKYHLKKIEKLIGQKIPEMMLPETVKIEKTPFEELQEIRRELDDQRKKDDPEYLGAFHEKKPVKPDKVKRKKR
jgi:ATP-dependent RNA helicase RhlE